VRAQKVYKKYGKTRGVSILKKLGYKNAKFTGKIIDQSFGTFTI
jgi:hypothetical protein